MEVDDGIKRLSMRFVKRYAAPDRARLSSELCERISEAFEELGLITLPRRLPTSENDFVWVIKRDSPLGEVVEVASALVQLDKMGQNPLPALFANFPAARKSLDQA
ncbi:hypothetical protein ACIRJS_29120 [Streptomyces sp. NPDC102340]|uniref:hypothetical protein n=1 Tax=unclassified Streptomyces TaxID=2593676 RepID=UPI00382532E6